MRPAHTALLALLDLPVEDPEWQALNPPQRRRRILDAVKGLLQLESARAPLVLVFEDLHWADSETVALLDSLVDSLPTMRTLLLVNYRPEFEHRWGGRTYYTQLRIDPLPVDSAERLLDALLGDDPSLAALERTLVERTHGNPLFLEEAVRDLAETGHARSANWGAIAWLATSARSACLTPCRRSLPRASTGCPLRPSNCCSALR